MTSAPEYLISVITATLNCAQDLQQLKKDLCSQTDQTFQWVVVDGGSTDETLNVASDFPPDRLCLHSAPDFGIYDALNKAVRIATGKYYLVVGADDRLEADAIEFYSKEILASDADIISASVKAGPTVLQPVAGKRWLRGGNALVSSHAVGCVIRRSLHDSVGFYSNQFVNAADMHFIVKAVDLAGASVIGAKFLAGRFGVQGQSSTGRLCSLTEAYRIQLAMGHNRWIQLALLTFRLAKVRSAGSISRPLTVHSTSEYSKQTKA